MKNLPLHNEHKKLNAFFSEFAGFNMPIHYGSIIEETLHTRQKVSIFDISHMGEFLIVDNTNGDVLDTIITVPIKKLKVGKCKYGFLLNKNGGIIDDLIVYKIKENEFMIVVNASNEKKDERIILDNINEKVKFKNISNEIVKIDIQGPLSDKIMENFIGEEINELKYFSFSKFNIYEKEYIISRTGYTGEKGYEIYIDIDNGKNLWEDLLKYKEIKPAGLGARDILRLEAGYPLHGNELDENTTPLDAGMERFIDFEKDFIGKDALLKQRKTGVKKKLIGFIVEGRRKPAHNDLIYYKDKKIGYVTSGSFSPHLNKGIGMGYVDKDFIERDIEIYVRKDRLPAQIIELPFIKNTSLKN